MTWALVLGGIVAATIGWSLVREGRSIWYVMPPLYGALGIIAIARGELESVVNGGMADLLLGLAAGAGLFLATRLAVVLLRHWPAFERDAAQQYASGDALSKPTVLALSLVVLGGEELFWRGWLQGSAAQADIGSVAATALVAWIGYVAANLASGNRVIWAGAAVGGAVWGALAALTGGVLAPLASHAAWTVSMILLPPALARGKMQP